MRKILFIAIIISGIHHNGFAQEKDIPVIIIISDQLRYDAIGKYTPHINQLKADGVSFNRTYCASPICVPSRAAFFTGKYPNNNGSLINGWQSEDQHYREVKSGTPNIYQSMEKHWESWHVGKQHFFTQDKIDTDPLSKTKWITLPTYKQWVKEQGEKGPGGREFTAMAPELINGKYTDTKRYTTPKYAEYKPGLKYFEDEFFAEKAVDIIKRKSGSRPLLLNVMFMSPHPPFNVPEPYYSKFKTQDLTIPDNVGKWFSGQSPLQLYNLTGFIGTRYSRNEWEQIWTKYFGLVSLMDDEVGKIIDALKQKGIYDKALIIFTADHGEMLGSHSLWQKMCMYEESAHVPLVIKFPRDFRPALKETDQMASLIDVWPTLMDYLKINSPDKPDGISLIPLLQGKSLIRDRVFIQYDGNGAYGNNQRCVVEGDFKLIMDTYKDEIFLELYNLKKDPEEKENLAANPQYEAMSKQLIAHIREHMVATNDLLKFPDNVYENFVTHYLKKQKSSGDD